MLEVACLEDDQDLPHLKDMKDAAIKACKLKPKSSWRVIGSLYMK